MASAAIASLGLVVVVVGEDGAGVCDKLMRTCVAALPLVSRMVVRITGAVDEVVVRATLGLLTEELASMDDEASMLRLV